MTAPFSQEDAQRVIANARDASLDGKNDHIISLVLSLLDTPSTASVGQTLLQEIIVQGGAMQIENIAIVASIQHSPRILPALCSAIAQPEQRDRLTNKLLYFSAMEDTPKSEAWVRAALERLEQSKNNNRHLELSIKRNVHELAMFYGTKDCPDSSVALDLSLTWCLEHAERLTVEDFDTFEWAARYLLTREIILRPDCLALEQHFDPNTLPRMNELITRSKRVHLTAITRHSTTPTTINEKTERLKI